MKSFSFVIILLCQVTIDCSKSLQFAGIKENAKSINFVVSIQKDTEHVCCASIVAERWVLTVSACIKTNINKYFIRYGALNCYSLRNIYEMTRNIVELKNSTPAGLSLLKVDEAFNQTVFGDFARLPSAEQNIMAGHYGLVYGWEMVPERNVLKIVLFRINDRQDIINNHTVTNYEFNAGGNGTGISRGNIGSPFILGDKMIGIASDISSFLGSSPDIFYRVSEFIEWIGNVTTETIR